jgi:hypothetical protein
MEAKGFSLLLLFLLLFEGKSREKEILHRLQNGIINVFVILKPKAERSYLLMFFLKRNSLPAAE